MLWPKAEGGFEGWSALEPTLMPILTKQVGRQFMPWTCANEKALADAKEEFSVAASTCFVFTSSNWKLKSMQRKCW